MKKGNKIFVLIFLIEIVLFLVSFSSKTCYYSNPCSVPTFLNPLGIQFGVCIEVLEPAQCNIGFNYLIIWLIIFTFITYLIYKVKTKK